MGQALVRREWLAFGFKFGERGAQLGRPTREAAPVFTQFLDCVVQLLAQFPAAFEFSPAYLAALHQLAVDGTTGTFLGDCERERHAAGLAGRTPCAWRVLDAHRAALTNAAYRAPPPALPAGAVLAPNPAAAGLVFWAALYAPTAVPPPLVAARGPW